MNEESLKELLKQLRELGPRSYELLIYEEVQGRRFSYICNTSVLIGSGLNVGRSDGAKMTDEEEKKIKETARQIIAISFGGRPPAALSLHIEICRNDAVDALEAIHVYDSSKKLIGSIPNDQIGMIARTFNMYSAAPMLPPRALFEALQWDDLALLTEVIKRIVAYPSITNKKGKARYCMVHGAPKSAEEKLWKIMLPLSLEELPLPHTGMLTDGGEEKSQGHLPWWFGTVLATEQSNPQDIKFRVIEGWRSRLRAALRLRTVQSSRAWTTRSSVTWTGGKRPYMQ